VSPGRVSEAAPVQVYLDRTTKDRLDRLVVEVGTNKSDILRRGLLALERELSDPASHPALRVAGVGNTSAEHAYDVAREHDAFLAGVSEPQPHAYAGRRTRRKKNG
jgi:hypothetical protein